MNTTLNNLRNLINALPSANLALCIVGDIILDRYIIGYPERISREAPVLVLEEKESFERLGGGANTALNAAALGATVNLIGCCGEDSAGLRVSKCCLEAGIKLTKAGKSLRTTQKTRILSTNQSRKLVTAGTKSAQQILRIDDVHREDLSGSDLSAIVETIERLTGEADVVLFADYGLGAATPAVVEAIKANRPNRYVIVDPSRDPLDYLAANLLLPNQPDFERSIGLNLDETLDAQNFAAILKPLAGYLGSGGQMIITRGAEGMLLITSQGEIYSLPAFNRAEVFDVTGAGDTVAATVGVALQAGFPLQLAMVLANLAASIVVRKAGCACTDGDELLAALEEQEASIMNTIRLH